MLQRLLDRKTRTDAGAFLFQPPSATAYETADRLGYFYGIDLLRGLAAITILIWHYQHFFVGLGVAHLDNGLLDYKAIQPYYRYLQPFYEHGFWAVDTFWAISGFVFCHVYAGRDTSASSFVVARFARLYPLHFITLITIATLQSISFALVGKYQLVASNNPISFIWNLLFVSGWIGGQHFNGPIWSVSVELAIYAGFFVLARRIFSFGLLIPGFIVFVCLLFVSNQSPVNNFHLCGFFFFLGAMIYWWVLKFRDRPLAILIPCAVSLAVYAYYILAGLLPHMRWYHVSVFLIAPLVALTGWFDFSTRFRALIKPVKWVGDATYSTYLWHFPMQVAILLMFTYFGWSSAIFVKRTTLVIWVVGMILLAHLSFRYIERPLQRFCKSQWKKANEQSAREGGK